MPPKKRTKKSSKPAKAESIEEMEGGEDSPAQTTRIIRTEPYQLLGVILRNSDYADFNESTIKNAQRFLLKTKPRARKKKPVPALVDQTEPNKLLEEFQKAEEFEFCIEYHKPERYMLDGRKIVDSAIDKTADRPSASMFLVDRKPKGSRPASNVSKDASILEKTTLHFNPLAPILEEHPTLPQSIDEFEQSIVNTQIESAIDETVNQSSTSMFLVERKPKGSRTASNVSKDEQTAIFKNMTPHSKSFDSILEEQSTLPQNIDDFEQSIVNTQVESVVDETVDKSSASTFIIKKKSNVLRDSSNVSRDEQTAIFKNTTRHSKSFDSILEEQSTLPQNIDEFEQSIVNTQVKASVHEEVEDENEEEAEGTLINEYIPQSSNVGRLRDSLFDESITSLLEASIDDDPLEQLLHACNQYDAITFSELLDFKSCIKLGEGTFGEVFKAKVDDKEVALKIVPFTTQQEAKKINGDFMKFASAILPEVVISQQLSLLTRNSFKNTNGFANVVQMSVVKGKYPKQLIKAWKDYKADVKNKKAALNDSPLEYSNDDQYYMAIALENGGKDLDNFKLKNEKEAMSILIQVILSLRIAEEKLEFEHRDLHIGNILVRRFDDDSIIKFKLSESDEKCVHSYGVISTIIDFTNSRISQDGLTIFVDLSMDNELFEGPTNDYQFQIYRDMKSHNNNDWATYNPKSNCLWIHYLSRKILEIKGIRIKRRKELQGTFDLILGCNNLSEFMELQDVKDIFEPHFTSDPNLSEEQSK